MLALLPTLLNVKTVDRDGGHSGGGLSRGRLACEMVAQVFRLIFHTFNGNIDGRDATFGVLNMLW